MSSNSIDKRNAIIVGLNSDIGIAIGDFLEKDGWKVFGTTRKLSAFNSANMILDADLSDFKNIDWVAEELNSICPSWDLLIFAAGTMKPIGAFFETDSSDFSNAFSINFIGPLRLLKGIWPHRTQQNRANVIFFAGGGTNGPFDNFSAYGISKVSMIKMVEFLASENPDVGFFSLGPGFVRTKIHEETLASNERAGSNREKTLNFLKSEGTPLLHIYNGIKWCIQNSVVGSGRNFSLQHDNLSEKSNNLISALSINSGMYKLRRYMNNWEE
jgi:NAD(P)-dependent dehydrogenase (short-subunit alcohol dehydrogenase family)